MPSPTQLALARLHGRAWPCQVVERWINTPGMAAAGGPPGRRIDLFGCIDIIAIDDHNGVLGIQVTSPTNHASRVAKAKKESRLIPFLKRGNRFEVWSFKKTKPSGYSLRRTPLGVREPQP